MIEGPFANKNPINTAKNEIEEVTVSEPQVKTVSTTPNAKALSTFSKVAGFQRAEPFGRVSRREIPCNSRSPANTNPKSRNPDRSVSIFNEKPALEQHTGRQQTAAGKCILGAALYGGFSSSVSSSAELDEAARASSSHPGPLWGTMAFYRTFSTNSR